MTDTGADAADRLRGIGLMLLAVWIAVAVTVATFVALLAVIVVHRAWSGFHARRLARRRAELEPQLLRFIHSDERSVLAMLGGALPSTDREAMEKASARLSRTCGGTRSTTAASSSGSRNSSSRAWPARSGSYGCRG